MNILLNKTVVYFFGWLIHHESRNMKILINVFHIWFYIFGNKSSNDNMSNVKTIRISVFLQTCMTQQYPLLIVSNISLGLT